MVFWPAGRPAENFSNFRMPNIESTVENGNGETFFRNKNTFSRSGKDHFFINSIYTICVFSEITMTPFWKPLYHFQNHGTTILETITPLFWTIISFSKPWYHHSGNHDTTFLKTIIPFSKPWYHHSESGNHDTTFFENYYIIFETMVPPKWFWIWKPWHHFFENHYTIFETMVPSFWKPWYHFLKTIISFLICPTLHAF